MVDGIYTPGPGPGPGKHKNKMALVTVLSVEMCNTHVSVKHIYMQICVQTIETAFCNAAIPMGECLCDAEEVQGRQSIQISG